MRSAVQRQTSKVRENAAVRQLGGVAPQAASLAQGDVRSGGRQVAVQAAAEQTKAVDVRTVGAFVCHDRPRREPHDSQSLPFVSQRLFIRDNPAVALCVAHA